MTTYNNSAYNITTLAALTGMPKATAAAWLACEGQAAPNPTNPLNIRYWATAGQKLGPGANGSAGVGFASYSSSLAGLQDAAHMIATLSYYSGIRAAIPSRDAVKVAQAIEASPWAGGNYGGGPGKAGCIVQGVGGGSAPAPTPSSGTTPGVSTVAPAPTAAPFIDIPDGKVLTLADVLHIVDLYNKTGVFDGIGGNAARGKLMEILDAAVVAKKVWGPELRAQLQGQIQAAASDAGSAGGFLDFAWVPGFAVNGGILVLVVVLAYKGATRMLGPE